MKKYKEIIITIIILIIILGIILFNFYKSYDSNYKISQETNNNLENNNDIKSINECSYKHFKPQFWEGFDYVKDMEFQDKIYHKEITTYAEYEKYKEYCDLIDLKEDDFNNKFVVITAIENTSMLGLTLSDIYCSNENTLNIVLNSFPEDVAYDKNETCICIVIPNYMKKEIVTLDGRKIEKTPEEKYNWVNTPINGLNGISLEEAIEVAKEYARNLSNSNSYMGKYLNNYTKVYSIERTTVRPNNYWLIQEGIIERNLEVANFERDAYEVVLVRPDDEVEIERAIFYVDMYKGEVIAGGQMSD